MLNMEKKRRRRKKQRTETIKVVMPEALIKQTMQTSFYEGRWRRQNRFQIYDREIFVTTRIKDYTLLMLAFF
jgi:DNA-directed RNA polymerase beta subunit